MSIRLPLGVAVLCVTFVAGNASVAKAWAPSRFAALAARQDLRDEVCVALSLDNGQISPNKRAQILADAKNILSPTEFDGFRHALDRLSPPQKVEKSPAQRAAELAQRKSSSLTRRQALQLLAGRPASGPVMPEAPRSPERMASRGVVR